MPERWADAQIARFCDTYGGRKILPLAEPVALRGWDLEPVRVAIPSILGSQGVLLRHLLKSIGPAATFELLGVPPALAPWMSVLDGAAADAQPILRADVLPASDGAAWICELNIDSSVGGPECAEFARIHDVARGVRPRTSPYDECAGLMGAALARMDGRRVCILDWSTWAQYGAFGLEWMRKTLASRLPGTEVFIATERDGLDRIDKQTLVYRVFLAEDALTDPEFVTSVFDRAGCVLSDFSGELLSSKTWMALLHDASYRELLDAPALAAIDATIPMTVNVTSENLPALLGRKHELFFKAACDFGGHGVIAGASATDEDIRRSIGSPESSRWIAQRACDLARFDVRPLGAVHASSTRCVLGMYRYGAAWSGLMVRASTGSDVINVAAGATVGWGYEVAA
jgi:hypothetical protein